MKISLMTRLPVAVMILLILVIPSSFIGCGQDNTDSNISSPTAPDLKNEPVDLSNTFVDAQQLTVAYAGEIHNQITHYCNNQFRSYDELATALYDDQLLPEIYRNILAGGSLDYGKDNLPTPEETLLPRSEKTFVRLIKDDLYGRFENLTQQCINDGSLSQAVGTMMLEIAQQLYHNPINMTDLTQQVDTLAQLADDNGQEYEVMVIGVFTGSFEYWSGQWPGGDPPQIAGWTILADVVGGLVGLPGAGTSIITAGLFSAAAYSIEQELE